MAERTCPVWVGHLLASPIRRLFLKPEKVLAPYVRAGMTVLEVGPGMGFFTLPLAEMVGDSGRVVAVDVQQGMVDQLRKRAAKAGRSARIEARLCSQESLGIEDLSGRVDFVLLYAVVHEVHDQERLFADLSAAGKKGCMVLFAEPRGHVTEAAFAASLAVVATHGFALDERPAKSGGLSAVLRRI